MTDTRRFDDLSRFDNPVRYDDYGNTDPEGTRVDYADYLALRKILVGSLWGLGISAEVGLNAMRERDEIRHELHTLKDTLP